MEVALTKPENLQINEQYRLINIALTQDRLIGSLLDPMIIHD